ncbi:tetratricopeptide repeat protein [Pedobacter sp. P351]|uniref:tetratricopeptide repeat protein n=1 Tax=Pedobacter superstes TaxID=3133441 RepID=UPI0030A66372
MNHRCLIIYTFLVLLSFSSFSQSYTLKDSLRVDSLNKSGYDIRLTDPERTLFLGRKALALATKTDYINGIAEAYRILGIGYSYLGKNDKAIANYLISLSHFKEANNLTGEAKIYNNIGNLYKEINYNKALEYFVKALNSAEQLKMPDLIAASYLNIGVINYRKKDYSAALKHFEKSHSLFLQQNNLVGTTLALQNQGVIYYSINKKEKAEKLLLEANKKAKEAELNSAIASINLTLVSIYIDKKDYKKAEYYLNEGKEYALIGKSTKLQSDLLKTSYQLENKRNNYRQALLYLQELYTQDSIELQNNMSKKFGLFEEQSKFAAREKESAIELEKAKTNRIIFVAAIAISSLAVILIIILVLNLKKKAKTNKLLQILNEEISIQKENLNKVNYNLEQIIDERTKDLQIKNRKLSEYSSHLSHQIRGPVATMKGLMILEKESLIDDKDFIIEMSKCVNEVDDRIININDVLHNLSQPGFIPTSVDKENKS